MLIKCFQCDFIASVIFQSDNLTLLKIKNYPSVFRTVDYKKCYTQGDRECLRTI